MSTPKRNTVVFNNNNGNSNTNNTQTPKTPKSQNSPRVTPSPKRTRKPLFDDTPPIQRYNVKMAKDRFKSNAGFRKEIRDIYHQSDQFATFQQKSALVVPTELTPERYVLGKYNAIPDKNQKDRIISRKVTKRTDLLDRQRYQQEQNNNENSEVLVEEIEEIDYITEEQQNPNSAIKHLNKPNSNENQPSVLQFDKNEDSDDENQFVSDNKNETANKGENEGENGGEDNNDHADNKDNDENQENLNNKGDDNKENDENQENLNNENNENKENLNNEGDENKENLNNEGDGNKENLNNEGDGNKDDINKDEDTNAINNKDGVDNDEENKDKNDKANNEVNDLANHDEIENNEITVEEEEIEDDDHNLAERNIKIDAKEDEDKNEQNSNNNLVSDENLLDQLIDDEGDSQQVDDLLNHIVSSDEQENLPEQDENNGNDEKGKNQQDEEEEIDQNTIQIVTDIQIEEEEEENNEDELNNQTNEHETNDHNDQENNNNNEQENQENNEQANKEESQENEQEHQENEQANQQENQENNEQENEQEHQEENQENEQENEQVNQQENQENNEQENEQEHQEENQENEQENEQANQEENQENNEQEQQEENEHNQENDHHEETEHQPSDQDDEIPVPDMTEGQEQINVTNRNAAKPFMPPSSPPRFKKLDRNDPKINHTGDQLLEISLRPYLYSLTNKYGTPINTIRDIPSMEFNDWQSMGFDWVWLYGVWQIGEFVIQHDLIDGTLLNRYKENLPDWQREDVIGYPLCIYKYEVCPEVGSEENLQWFRMEMKKRGIKLMLDFVPNDTAIDSPEMTTNPDFYIKTNIPTDSKEFDSNRFMLKHNGIAFGAGEHMPPMHFNAQLNLFNKKCRDYQIERMIKVSHLCDGLRVHLAQYLINSKFADFWKNELFNQETTNIIDIDYNNENEEFWTLAISKIRSNYPNFVMMAESYGYENQAKLLNCGFNYVYEKELLDKLVYSDVKGFRDLIFNNEFLTSKKMVHFVENHDEARVLHRFWKDERMACAASAALLTLPGIRLINFHQWLGYMNQIDVNLRRSYDLHMNKYIMLFYVRLFRVLDTNAIRFGEWTPKNVYDSETVIAWKWVKGNQHILVAINFSMNRSGGRIICNDAPTEMHEITVHELISNTYYTRDPQELIDTGLHLSLDKYETQIFEY